MNQAPISSPARRAVHNTSPAIPLQPILPPVFNQQAETAVPPISLPGSASLSPFAASPQYPQNGDPTQQNATLASTASGVFSAFKTKWHEFWTASNGIGLAAVVLAISFGIGAWMGMNMQYSQGVKSLELTIWTTCVDHEAIQKTNLCQEVMGKGFDHFHPRPRDVDELAQNAVDVAKREVIVVTVDGDTESTSSAPNPSPIEVLLSNLSPSERSLIFQHDRPYDSQNFDSPELRATVFPLIHFIYTPIRLLFGLIESLLLTAIVFVHKLFKWLAIAVFYCFQAFVYSFVEGIVKNFLGVFDTAISQAMPAWVPPIFTSGLATAVGVSAMKSYWYSISFLECIKWVLIMRAGLFAVWQLGRAVWVFYNAWRDHLKRRA